LALWFCRRANQRLSPTLSGIMKLLSQTGAATDGGFPGEAPARPEQTARPTGVLAVLRLALGGAICGGFLGSFGGALLGILLGTCKHDFSLGLDGALIGGLVLAIIGAIYGLVFA
jgi:predicted lipid-binding transport protein (Tim44 family)